jgi:hypothetical protein
MIIQNCLKFFQQSSQAIVEQVTVRAICVEQGHQSVKNCKSTGFCSKFKIHRGQTVDFVAWTLI